MSAGISGCAAQLTDEIGRIKSERDRMAAESAGNGRDLRKEEAALAIATAEIVSLRVRLDEAASKAADDAVKAAKAAAKNHRLAMADPRSESKAELRERDEACASDLAAARATCVEKLGKAEALRVVACSMQKEAEARAGTAETKAAAGVVAQLKEGRAALAAERTEAKSDHRKKLLADEERAKERAAAQADSEVAYKKACQVERNTAESKMRQAEIRRLAAKEAKVAAEEAKLAAQSEVAGLHRNSTHL